MERDVAQRQAALRQEMQSIAAARHPGRVGIAIAGALRDLADRLDGGEPQRRWTLRVLE